MLIIYNNKKDRQLPAIADTPQFFCILFIRPVPDYRNGLAPNDSMSDVLKTAVIVDIKHSRSFYYKDILIRCVNSRNEKFHVYQILIKLLKIFFNSSSYISVFLIQSLRPLFKLFPVWVLLGCLVEDQLTSQFNYYTLLTDIRSHLICHQSILLTVLLLRNLEVFLFLWTQDIKFHF